MIDQILTGLWKKIKTEQKLAFGVTFFTGLLIHMPAYLMDVPNHDGLASMYFDQNMITSGRWLLGLACSVSSYFTLPWLIGILSLFWVSVAAVLLTELLQPASKTVSCLMGMLLVSFPALASTYAYIFTADGYMLGLALAIGAVLCTARFKRGYLWGAVCLACSLGIYQSYLPFAMLLSLYMVLTILLRPALGISTREETAAGREGTADTTAKEKLRKVLPYPIMGALGFALYEIILHVLLLIQGKELDTYQGINSLEGSASSLSFVSKILGVYRDFFAFTLKGQVLFHNVVSLVLIAIVVLRFMGSVVFLAVQMGYPRKILNVLWVLLFILICPICTNVVLLISPDVTYHLLMRYQWVLYLILMLAVSDRACNLANKLPDTEKQEKGAEILLMAACFALVIFYGVTDNIAYSNLQKKYEKTYGYCLRLADRMEQTEGYYQGIPVAMIGVVSEDAYPQTDITGDVTAGMIGMTGDYLLYTARNYQAFFKHYLGITMEIVSDDQMGEIYYSDAYQSLDTFPGENSMKVVDGILYVKLENSISFDE